MKTFAFDPGRLLCLIAILLGGQPLPAADDLFLIPTPAQATRVSGTFRFTPRTRIVLAQPTDPDDRFAAQQVIEEAAADLGVTLSVARPDAAEGSILIGPFGSPMVEQALKELGVGVLEEATGPFRERLAREACAVGIGSNRVVVAGGGAAGIFYGCQTLRQLIRANAQEAAIPCCRIVDRPALAYRCWQNDISRGPIPTLAFLKQQVAAFSEFKLNALTLYTENVFKNPKHPKIAPADGLTAEEARELCQYARRYHVEVLGNHQAFGHYEKTLRLPEYAGLRENEAVLTPAREETYRFLKDVIDVIAPAYDSPLFVINCDETFGLGEGPSKKMVQEMGLGGVYAYHIGRLHRMLQDHGKTPLMWGDIALHHRDIVPRLPKDLIVLSWGYEARPSFDDTIQPFTDLGFRFWVCPGVSSWVWIWPDHRTAAINIANYVRDGVRFGAMGMLNTTWGDDGEQFFNYTWHPQIWAAEVAWHPAMPPAGTPGLTNLTAKPSAAWLAAADRERDRRLAAFDRAYPRLLFGLPDDTASQAVWKLDQLRGTRMAAGLGDSAFWQDPLQGPLPASAKTEAEAARIRTDAEEARKVFVAARASARLRAEALDFAAFAARRVGFLGLRAQARLGMAKAWAECEGDKEKAVAALRGPIRARLAGLRDEVGQLRLEYSRLWPLENRPFWLPQVLERYDGLLKRLDDALGANAKAADALERDSVWPDAERLKLIPGGSGQRSITPTKDPQAQAKPTSSWHWPAATHRLPMVWDAGQQARRDAPLEWTIPLKTWRLPADDWRSFGLTEVDAEGRQTEVSMQAEIKPNGSAQLAAMLKGTSKPGQRRHLLLYAGPAPGLGSAAVSGAVSVKADPQGGYWIENNRYRAHLGSEGAHLYAFHVRAAQERDVTMPGEKDWQGFCDTGPAGRHANYRFVVEASGPVLARIRCTSEAGVEKTLSFWAGTGWYEAIMEDALSYYWDFDDPLAIGSTSSTPGQALFSDRFKAPLPKTGEVSLARPATLWGLKYRADGLVLACITPGRKTIHRVGPGDSMGGVGIEGGGESAHFVTLCDVISDDPAVTCDALATTLDLKNRPRVTVGEIQARPPNR